MAAYAFLAVCLAAAALVGGDRIGLSAAGTGGPGVEVTVSGVGVLGYVRLDPDDRLGVTFVHSVDLLPVEDWFVLRDGALVQRSTRLIQYGTGMGQIAGQGTGRSDGRWWVVDGMNRHIGTLRLRIGAASVDHRLRYPNGMVTLSECWPGELLTVRPTQLPSGATLLGADRTGCDTR